MIVDGKPAHWPKMLDAPAGNDEQSAVRTLHHVRNQIVAFRREECDEDWRVAHAQSDRIENVVAGLIADATAINELHEQSDRRVSPLKERVEQLEQQLAESKRPFSAQMEMQNRRIIALTAEVDRLTLDAMTNIPRVSDESE